MTDMTVNKAIKFADSLRERIADLQRLRNANDTFEKVRIGDETTEKEPLYDPVAVDTQIVDIKNALVELNSAIQESNAKTKIYVDIDQKSLLSPIKGRERK